jgi:glycosyltransferase involved in cell wall biosynthesis
MRCSVIIPVYNAENTIALCLESALNQSLPTSEYEVIVVDDGSTDNTPRIAKNYPVKIINQENQGPAAARNRGAKEAKGNILIFTDSDCELDSNFVEKIIAPIEQTPEVAGVQGSYKTKQTQFMARFGQVEIETRYRKMARKKYIDFIGTYAAAYKKDIFHKSGGFDTGFLSASGEDTEFSYKLQRNGHKMVFEPQSFVYHQHPFKLGEYIKVKFYRGYWRIRLYKKHPQKTINDSYTPQTLKIQVLSIPLIFLFAVMSLFNVVWLLVPISIISLFIFFSMPFFRLFEEKKYSKAIFIPAVLLLRAMALFFGIVFGLVNEFANSAESDC